MKSRDNAITRRVGILSNQWLDFAGDDKARILSWQLEADEVRMFDAFLALELDASTAEHSDLFVTLETAFDSAPEHGQALCHDLSLLYQREQALLREADVEADWAAPARERSEPDTAFLVRSCESFAAQHGLPARLVLVLRPGRVADAAAYRAWLVQLALALPVKVRAIVLNAASAPIWPEPGAQANERVVIRRAALDMAGAYAEISQSAGHLDTPGGRFRENFLQLSAALGDDDLTRALRLGDTALAITASERWFHLSVPIHAMLGGALASAGRTEQAKGQFVAAEQSALRGQAEGAPDARDTCAKLRLQSRLGLGSALIAGESYADAAQVFADTIPIAAGAGDHSVWLDCHRLAAFCHARAGAPDVAFRWAREGLIAAKQVPPDVLAISNFPHLVDTLLGLCEPAGRQAARSELEREITALLPPAPQATAQPEPSLT